MRLLGCLCLLVCGAAGVVRAEAPRGRLVIIHDDAPALPESLGIAVDGLLLQALAGARFASIQPVAISFADLALAVDCGAQHDGACLERMGQTLEADWILLRKLAPDVDGEIVLSLSVQSLSSPVPVAAAARITAHGLSIAERVVSELVERLLCTKADVRPVQGAPEHDTPPLEAASADRAKAPEPASRARLSWQTSAGASLLATSVGLMAGGIALGRLAQRDRHEYVRAEIATRYDVDRAELLLARSLDRIAAARALWASGAGLALLGAASVWWGVRRARHGDVETTLAVAPSQRGLHVALSGSFAGAL